MDAKPTSPRFRRYRTLAVATFSLAALAGAAPAMAFEGVGDRVFHDVNNNGIFGAGEVGIAGVTVTIELDNGDNSLPIDPVTARREGASDCLPDALPAYPGRTQATNADGAYYFNGVGEGNYIIEVAPSNFVAGGPLAGWTSSTGSALTTGPYEPGIVESGDVADDNKDHGTVSGDRIRICNVKLRPNEEPVGESPTPGITLDPVDASQNTTVDFGVFKPASGGGITPGTPPKPSTGTGPDTGGTAPKPAWRIGDRVWSDADKDGIQDPAEVGIEGVEVTFYDSVGAVLGVTTTDRRGAYRFDGLLAGTFRLGFGKLPRGAKASPNGKGNNRKADSDVIPSTGRTSAIRVAAGDLRIDIDAGFFVPTMVAGRVWTDTDGDGQQDADEKGVRGVTVTLTNVVDKTVRRNPDEWQGQVLLHQPCSGPVRRRDGRPTDRRDVHGAQQRIRPHRLRRASGHRSYRPDQDCRRPAGADGRRRAAVVVPSVD